jgi:hypothetical protein
MVQWHQHKYGELINDKLKIPKLVTKPLSNFSKANHNSNKNASNLCDNPIVSNHKVTIIGAKNISDGQSTLIKHLETSEHPLRNSSDRWKGNERVVHAIYIYHRFKNLAVRCAPTNPVILSWLPNCLESSRWYISSAGPRVDPVSSFLIRLPFCGHRLLSPF